VINVARLLPLTVGCGLVSGCMTFIRGAPIAWYCASEVVAGDLKGSGFYHLDARGRPISNGGDWEWRANDRDFRVALKRWFTDDQLVVSINAPADLNRMISTTELRVGSVDQPQSDATLIERASERPQHNVRLSRTTFEHLASSGRPLFVVGLGTNGAVIRVVRLDMTALPHGELAMRSAKQQAEAMTPNFRQLCSPEYGGDPIVIA